MKNRSAGRIDPDDLAATGIGLIAGNGTFPFLVLEEAGRRGIPVVTIAIRGEADPEIEKIANPVHWVHLGQLSRCVSLLRQGGLRHALMAGQVKHKKIFSLLHPDRLLLRVLSRLESRNTDAILGTVADVLGEEGIELVDSTCLLSSLLARNGPLSKRKPTRKEKADIDFGFRMARELARLDIGQTVVIKDRAVVAAEAMEGTDETIRRAGNLVGELTKGLTVVKVARPSQDMRFDVPVVGPRTIQAMRGAGATVLAMESGRSLLLDRDVVLEEADMARIAIFGVSEAS